MAVPTPTTRSRSAHRGVALELGLELAGEPQHDRDEPPPGFLFGRGVQRVLTIATRERSIRSGRRRQVGGAGDPHDTAMTRAAQLVPWMGLERGGSRRMPGGSAVPETRILCMMARTLPDVVGASWTTSAWLRAVSPQGGGGSESSLAHWEVGAPPSQYPSRQAPMTHASSGPVSWAGQLSFCFITTSIASADANARVRCVAVA
jgi:hypothetical protein